ncbi:hypothetical protein FHP25_16035 [Vineibacter terrae]|uniref:Uncharacterized protein n=1 Tax=Vineibacter terrae TaxID=2586908 RepID=A0A5C8PM59_9HYPH|nr:hypothetical protein [Vineibacter terrae]TXL74594.1 hypothetical protein FHP25_16035 [Vineibacter terrae]
MSDLLTRKAATTAGQPSLSCNTKAAAVAILKNSPTLDARTKMMLTPYLVDGIISAEAKRIGKWERRGETYLWMEWDWLRQIAGGVGPGQLYPAAYNEVMQRLNPELKQYLVHMGVNCGAGQHRGCGEFPLTLKGYPLDVMDPVTADFFIAATLALKIKESLKPGRNADDQLQFGIGRYFGAFSSLQAAQTAICPQNPSSVVHYPPVRDWLLRSSSPRDRDVAAYIQEVFGRR